MEFLQTHRLSQSIVNVRNVAPVREHKLAATFSTRWQQCQQCSDAVRPRHQSVPFEFVNIVDATFVHTLLHYTPDLVVDWVQVRTVRWPQIKSDEVGCLALQQLNSLTDTMGRRTVLLKDEHVTCDRLDGRKHLLREQDIAVILAIDLCTRIHEDESLKWHPLFRHGDWHLSLIHIWRCRRSTLCRSRWSPYH